MASKANYIQLAQALPPRLLRFFARYPPAAILPSTQPSEIPGTAPNLSSPEHDLSIVNSPTGGSDGVVSTPSPFQAHKHPVTGRWHNPVFSLRRQADLVKMARKHGVEELLPYTVKGTAERQRKREENGLRIKGTGVGQRPKGKEWERTMKGRLEKRRQAMLDMPKMIQTWKERGHGRGWKKWPKS